MVDGKSRDELDTVLKGEFVKIYAHNLAYRVLLHNLVSHVAKTEPQFVVHLRRQFDTALGMELGEKGPTDVEASRIEARAVFMDILDRIKIDTQKPSLRRRFLNWIERG